METLILSDPFTKSYPVYVGDKIRSCVFGWRSPETAYHWRITLKSTGSCAQAHLGPYRGCPPRTSRGLPRLLAGEASRESLTWNLEFPGRQTLCYFSQAPPNVG